MSPLDLWESAGIALAIGLLIGAERERALGSAGSAGIRTFALVAVLGNVVSLVPVPVAAVLAASVAILVGIEYSTTRRQDAGLTTEVALLTTLALGYLTRDEPALAVGAAVATVVLLVSKEALHHFVRDTVTDLEQTDALKFFVIAFVVLPLLPTGHFGPYDVWVPQRIWLLVVLITGIGWVGYAASRVLGARRGMLVAGLAGGFVSGTATIGAMAARSRHGLDRSAALAGALMASVATLIQIAVLVSVADPRVAGRLAAALLLGGLVLLAEALLLGRRQTTDPSHEPAIGRPFALVPALVLAAVVSGVLLLATWMNHRYGSSGAMLAAATGSLADTHASAVAVSSLAHDGQISVETATLAVALGLATNTGSKVVAALAGGGRSFALTVLLLHLPAAAVMAPAVLLSR
ncbi:MAG TPA: DUF4010 domain-containing protein [Nocardioidaceae bacterium]|nr:DUF4010 domain-containing protein [Nocardioidaceae bacterium]